MLESNDQELKAANMQSKLMIEFRNDPLYRIFVDRNQELELFNDEFILNLEDTRLYSTPEVAEMFKIPVGTLRNYIYALDEYIRPIGAGRLIKLNYESIFRLHMIFQLKGEYSVPMLRSKLLGKFQFENESKDLVSLQKMEQLEQELQKVKAFLAEMGKLGLFQLSGTDPTNLHMTLNHQLLESVMHSVISKNIQPLLEGKNEEIEHLKEELKTLNDQLEQSQNQNQQLKDELERVKQQVDQQVSSIQLEYDKETQRFLDFQRAMQELKEEKELRRQALKAWSELSFFARLGKDKDAFIEAYIAEHQTDAKETEED